jgi:hypothetical protein
MKTVLKISAIAIISMFLNACGGGGSNNNNIDKSNYGTNERMVKDKVYTVNKGDEIEKLSDNPQLEIKSDLKTGKTEVKLLSGEASLIRY